MSCVRLRFHAHVQSHNQGSEVSLTGLRGHFLHTVTFLVFIYFFFFVVVCDKFLAVRYGCCWTLSDHRNCYYENILTHFKGSLHFKLGTDGRESISQQAHNVKSTLIIDAIQR